ncbi:C2 domain-containing protein 2-like, partial [Limulus polyphemus]|uniref:C2 domain-containing protein 2-like n=1 Tax=Limulus polyphemus TaxID=6850 RepID=A0ABM1RYC9_LIMPO
LRFFSNVEEVIFIVCFVDRPDIKLTLKPSDGSPKNSTHGQRSVEDAVVNIIINAIATATVDLHLEKHRNFPKCQHRKKEDSQKYSNLSILPYNSLSTRHEQRLLVKVIKANNLGSKKGCQEPFCVVEMDEPSQRFQTTVVKNTNNPFWDEHFLFNLKNSSAEILFEVYDRGKNSGATERFLGLGIIGVKELMNKPSQKLIIPLQSQPIGNDAVTGSLTVEFLFMDGAEVPVIGDTSEKPKELIESNSRITQGGTVITTTTFRASKGLEGSDETLVDTDLQNFDSKKKVESPSMIDDNTLIIHSIHGEVIRPVLKVCL